MISSGFWGVGGDVNEAGSMLVFMSRDDINLDLSLAPPMVDEQGAPPVVEEPLQPPVIADVFPEGGELEEIIQRLPISELRDLIGKERISRPIEASFF